MTSPLGKRWRSVLLLLAALWVPSVAEVRAQTWPLHTGCAPKERVTEYGCSMLAWLRIDQLPSAPLYWHLDAFASRQEAEARRTETGAVVRAHEQIWLLTVAPKEWRRGEWRRVATVGPIPVQAARRYGLLFFEGLSPAGSTAFTHKHSGPEAWYVLEGEQCVETPAGVFRARAGEGMVMPAGIPMSVSGPGAVARRWLSLVLHDGDAAPTVPSGEWTPTGRCLSEP